MRQQYPQLFEASGENFEDEILFMEGRAVDPGPESARYHTFTVTLKFGPIVLGWVGLSPCISWFMHASSLMPESHIDFQ